MLIETTEPFGNREAAEDNLTGIKNLPGFLFGYIREPSKPTGTFDLIHVFDRNGDTQHQLPKQRAIKTLELNEEAMFDFYLLLQV